MEDLKPQIERHGQRFYDKPVYFMAIVRPMVREVSWAYGRPAHDIHAIVHYERIPLEWI